MRSRHRDLAAGLLLHYFGLAIEDGLDVDNGTELRELVDHLVDAAKDELRSELLGEAKARYATLDTLDRGKFV